jgi:ribonucleoside-triphosphate reductase
MNVIKRSGEEVPFQPEKIRNAIRKANESVPSYGRLSDIALDKVVHRVIIDCEAMPHTPNVEDVQEIVETQLMEAGAFGVAKAYIRYRYEHALRRKGNIIDGAILGIVDYMNEEVKQENSNKNPGILPTQRDYMAGEISKDITRRLLLPKDIMDAHDAGIIHFHDADYFAQHMHNCDLLNLDDMLQNGTIISNTLIEKPHTFSTACNIATQIVAQVASSQYGGQTITLTHLAPFVESSRQKFRSTFFDLSPKFTPEEFDDFINRLVMDDIRRGVQILQYQIITLMTTNGQAPFVTVYADINEAPEEQRADLALIIEEVLRQRIQGVKNEKGVWVTTSFPKLIYALDDNNIEPGTPYYYLTELSAKCTAKRMVPDYISRKIMRELKSGDVYPCMGCRSFLTPDRFTDAGVGNIAKAKNYVPGKHKYYGRFNMGVVTINLPDVALSSGGGFDKFWKIFEERLELCHRALRLRYERLRGTPSDVAPILWQNGALARLEKGETIDKLLVGGYATISLGYAGLYECVKYMTGESHTGGGKDFALQVMKLLNDKCSEWKAAEDIDYSVYGSPIESTTFKFAKALQKRFGIIEGITDHNYITNSYHVCVREPIDAFTKLTFESEFQRLSPGGAVSYCEIPNMQHNIPAVLTLFRHIYDTIMYAELNTKSDYCEVCGFDGEIQIVKDENNKLVWECPNCGNRDQNKMHVVRRTCGYLGSNFWNQGRTQEIQERVLHL